MSQGTIIVAPDNSDILTEEDSSPTWSYSEKARCTRTFKGSYAACRLAQQTAAYRGYYVTSGECAGMRVVDSEVEKSTGLRGKLSVRYEGRSVYPPPTKYRIRGEKLERPLEEHPRYKDLFVNTDPPDLGINRLAALQAMAGARSSEDYDETIDDATVYEIIMGSENPEVTLAFPFDARLPELLQKMKRGMTHYLVYPPVIEIVVFLPAPPSPMNEGGYVETPPLPLTYTAPAGEWFRQADELDNDAAGDGDVCWYQLKMSWIGAPEWDHDVYPLSTVAPAP